MDVVKLSLSFAFAVKHYLRGEDGLDWNDYLDVMPSYFLRSGIDDSIVLDGSNRSSSYGAMMGSSITMTKPPRTESPQPNSGASTPDATKRIRVKRSNPTLSVRTPLLQRGSEDGHHGIDVHTEVTMPLPLMCVTFTLKIPLLIV
jgi:putative membrane protein